MLSSHRWQRDAQDPVHFAVKALYVDLVPSGICSTVVSVLPDQCGGGLV